MRTTAGTVLLLATAVLAGCTGQTDEPRPDPTGLVAQRLTELGQQAEAFSRLDVGDEDLAAWAVQDGTLRHWRLLDGTADSREVEQRYPAVDFAALHPTRLQSVVESLADGCDNGNFRVSVQALTPSAIVSELRCGDEEFEALGGSEPVAVRLGDEPLPDYGGLTVEETWQQVLDQASVLDPSRRLTSLTLDDERVAFGLSAASATNDCLPTVETARDGSRLSWRCDSPDAEPPLDLVRFDAAELAALQQQAMTDVGIIDPTGTEVRLARDVGGAARMTVRQGPRLSEVPLG